MADRSMEERFLRSGAAEPEPRRWSFDPRSWPRWIAWPMLFLAVVAVFAGGGAVAAALKDHEAVAGATWGLYGGGILLLFLGVAPFTSYGDAPTLASAHALAEQDRAARLSQGLQTLILLAAGAALIGLGLLLELYG